MIRVSAIVSIYCAERFMETCLTSLVKQTLFQKGELEIICIDVNSPENEKKIIRNYQDRFDNIRYIPLSKKISLYEAWNLGTEISDAEFIAIASTDDRYFSNSLEKMMLTLANTPSAGMCYGDWIQTTEGNSTKQYCRAGEFSRLRLLRYYNMGPLIMWRKSIHDQIGGFKKTYKIVGDWDWALRLSQVSRAHYMKETMGEVLIHSTSLSSKQNLLFSELQEIQSKWLTLEVLQEFSNKEHACPDIICSLVDLASQSLLSKPPWRCGSLEIFLKPYHWAIAEIERLESVNQGQLEMMRLLEMTYSKLMGATISKNEVLSFPCINDPEFSDGEASKNTDFIPLNLFLCELKNYCKEYWGEHALFHLTSHLESHQNENIYIWGASVKGGIIRAFLQQKGYQITGFIDEQKKGSFFDKPIISPNRISSISPDPIILIALNPAGFPSVKQFLGRTKIPKENYHFCCL